MFCFCVLCFVFSVFCFVCCVSCVVFAVLCRRAFRDEGGNAARFDLFFMCVLYFDVFVGRKLVRVSFPVASVWFRDAASCQLICVCGASAGAAKHL